MTGAVTATLLRPKRETIPSELKARNQWVAWRLELREDKPTKVPYYAPERKASSTDPGTWLSIDAAWMLYERGGFDGVGYVFGPDDPYCGIDLDGKDTDGLPREKQLAIATRFNSYTERSPGNAGLHIIVKGKLPAGGKKKGPLEVYDRARYFTVTGHVIEGASMVIEERQEAVDWLLATYFSQRRDTTSKTNGAAMDATDDELLARAFDAANGDKLRRLWNGDTTDYPSESEADLALASLLAFWAGPDAMKLETLMRRSGLTREKWDRPYGDGQTYLERVITKALSGRTEFYAAGNHANGGADRQASAPTPEPCWPTLAPEALHGLAGEIVNAIDPHTEADKVAVLVQFLAMFGCVIGRDLYFRVEWTRHPAKLFAVLVGDTSKGRKGTSTSTLKRIMEQVDPDFVSKRLKSGLSSGEGLIWNVRDPVYGPQKNRETGEVEEVMTDPGEADKRLLIVEPEFAQALKVMAREGNTLSTVIRQAFDDEPLTPLTKNNRITATGTHIAIIGHITKGELLRHLSETEMANGFCNRFIFLVVRRSKCLPNPAGLSVEQIDLLAQRLRDRIEQAHKTADAGPLQRDDEAERLWAEVYPALSDGKPGLTGAILGRGECHVMRLALTYALLAGANCIQTPHLLAALALWEYGEASARYIFGEATGDTVTDRILEGLRIHREMSESDILHRLFQRNVKAERIHTALSLLHRGKLISSRIEETQGRSRTLWRVTTLTI